MSSRSPLRSGIHLGPPRMRRPGPPCMRRPCPPQTQHATGPAEAQPGRRQVSTTSLQAPRRWDARRKTRHSPRTPRRIQPAIMKGLTCTSWPATANSPPPRKAPRWSFTPAAPKGSRSPSPTSFVPSLCRAFAVSRGASPSPARPPTRSALACGRAWPAASSASSPASAASTPTTSTRTPPPSPGRTSCGPTSRSPSLRTAPTPSCATRTSPPYA